MPAAPPAPTVFEVMFPADAKPAGLAAVLTSPAVANPHAVPVVEASPSLPPAAPRPAAVSRAQAGRLESAASRPRAAASARIAQHEAQTAEPARPPRQAVASLSAGPPRSVPTPAPNLAADSAPDPAAVAALEARIDQAVNGAKFYPPTARRLGVQGRSQVSFSYRDGTVTGVTLARSSAADMLDRAALEAVRHAAYPAAPPSLAHRPLQLAIWLDFSMRRAGW